MVVFPPLHKQTDEELERNRQWYSDTAKALDKDCDLVTWEIRNKTIRIYRQWIKVYDAEILKRETEAM